MTENNQNNPYEYPQENTSVLQRPEQVQAEKNRQHNKKIMKMVGYGAGGLLIFALGAGAGAGGSSNETAKAEPAPTETVEVEKEIEVKAEPEIVEKEVEVEVEKEIEVTPAACFDVMDAADDVIEEYSEAFFIASDMFAALEAFDVDAMDASLDELDAHTQDNVEPALTSYYLAADECEGASK